MASDHFDYLVIGGGSGGVASARRAATYNAKVRDSSPYSASMIQKEYLSPLFLQAILHTYVRIQIIQNG